MRKAFSLSLVAASVLGMGVLSTGTASALGGETLGCRFGTYPTYKPACVNGTQPYFTADFLVQNETAPSTYAWSISADYSYTLAGGCTSTTNYCDVQSAGGNIVTVFVTLTQDGASETLTASADFEQWCGKTLC